MIFSLVYVSAATRPFTDGDLAEVLEVSRRNNGEADITGMLLYDEGRIMQLLEGPEERVRPLYDRIAGDRRHDGLVRVWEGYEPCHHFPDWSMGFRRVSSSDLAGTPGLSDYLDRPARSGEFGASPTVGQELLAMFKQLG